jgi:hypothetical protein
MHLNCVVFSLWYFSPQKNTNVVKNTTFCLSGVGCPRITGSNWIYGSVSNLLGNRGMRARIPLRAVFSG